MNSIFIDFKYDNNDDNNIRLNKIRNKYFKYIVKDDILDNVLSKNTYITIEKEYIQNQQKKYKYSIYDRLLKIIINKKFKRSEEVNIIFSKEFDKYKTLKDYILNLFRLNSITRYDEVSIVNKIKENDLIYIDKYISDNEKDLNKLKILVVVNDIKDYDEIKMLEYISKYKFVDILITNNINKIDLKKIEKHIDGVNNEYGTTIDIIKKRNIQKYDVYLVYSALNKTEFKQQYILSSSSLYINMKDLDSDILSEEYLLYKRYEPEIITLLNRLNIKKENFSKVKLGFLFK